MQEAVKEKEVGIALALGDLFQDAGRGDLRLPPDGGIERFEMLTKALNSEDALVISSAGYSKENPLMPIPDRQKSLSEQLGRFVDVYRPAWSYRTLTAPRCWSTRNEIRVGIKIAQRVGFASKDEPVTLVVSSNKAHLWRIMLYISVYMPDVWTAKLVVAHHKFSWLDTLLEIPKIIRDLAYFTRVFWRLKRRRAMRR